MDDRFLNPSSPYVHAPRERRYHAEHGCLPMKPKESLGWRCSDWFCAAIAAVLIAAVVAGSSWLPGAVL